MPAGLDADGGASIVVLDVRADSMTDTTAVDVRDSTESSLPDTTGVDSVNSRIDSVDTGPGIDLGAPADADTSLANDGGVATDVSTSDAALDAAGDSAQIDTASTGDTEPSDATEPPPIGCGGVVAPGGLAGKTFDPCMGLPQILPSELDELTPQPLVCPAAPEVPAEITKSYSFKEWFFDWDPLSEVWAFPKFPGIQLIRPVTESELWLVGNGGLSGDFSLTLVYKGVVAAVDFESGLKWVQETSPGDYVSNFIAILSNGPGQAEMVGTREELHPGLWVIPEDGTAPIEDVQVDYPFEFRGATKSGPDSVVVATAGTWTPGEVSCEVFTAAELTFAGTKTNHMEGGGDGYQPWGKRFIVPLGDCGYGLVLLGTPVNNSQVQPVVLRLDDNLHVIGIWRWKLPVFDYTQVGEGFLVEPLDGDLLLAMKPNYDAPVSVFRIDGNSGQILWQTLVVAPSGYASTLDGFTLLPDGRSVVSSYVVDKKEPAPDNQFPMLSVVSPNGCVLVHYTFKGQKTDWDEHLTFLLKIVALSNTRLAGTTIGEAFGRSELVFIDLPPVP